jgi:FAD/FMN-containing dehydrogenase
MPAVLAAPATTILMPGDPGWDDARQAWSLSVDQHPAAVALPAYPQDIVDVVRLACRYGLRVAAQGTGHNAAPLGPPADTILVKTERMRRVSIDPAARIARAEAGAVWLEVVQAAAEHGLAALAGSSPDVGVVGYTIGGGMSWLGRAYGLSANNVEAIEVVTADGRLVRADACTETDLFWALRGGGGSFGVVTAIELRLFPIAEVYAGLLWWPADQAAEVLQTWRELTQSGLPEEFTTAARLLNIPVTPEMPAPLRGKSFVVIDVIHLGAPAEADRVLAPLRALMKRARPANGALAAVDADYALFAAGPAPFPQAAAAAARSVAEVQSAMSPWAARQMYLNLAETRRRPRPTSAPTMPRPCSGS